MPARPVLFVLLALALAAAACGGGDDTSLERSDPSTSTASPTSSVVGSAPTVAAADPSPTASSLPSPSPTSTVDASAASTSTSTPPRPVGADACPTIPRRAGPDPTRPDYDVDLDIDPVSGAIEGGQTVTFTPDLPINTLVFRLWANGPRPSSVGSSITVGTVLEDPAGRRVERRVEQPDPTTLVVHLDRTVEPGEPVTVAMPFRLQVNGPVNDRISRQDESLRVASFLPLLAWEPGIGWAVEPPTSGFAEATSSPVADWELTITAPDGFDVIASGVRSVPGTWQASLARDVSVAVGRFSIARATAMAPEPVEVVVAVHDAIDDASRYLDRLVASLEAFSRWYGPYPWPTYQLSITPDLSGGIEYPMHVLQGPGTDGRTTPHEVAHMWFYGLVGNNQGRDPWLDEGLATYAEGRLEGTLASMRSRSIPSDGRGRAGAPMTYWEGRASSYYRSVYVQPAAALSRIGRAELVDCALAHYVAEHAWQIARPIDVYESLDATFADWRPALAPAGLGN